MPSPPAAFGLEQIPTPRLRLRTPAEVVAVVPYLLGFVPERSVVAIALSGPRSTIGLTVRADLTPPDGVDAVGEIPARLALAGADEAILVVFDAEPDGAAMPGGARVDDLRHELREHDIDLREALLVRDGRWWSYLCTDPRCCPPEGTIVVPPDRPGGASRVAAAMALEGRAPLPSRAALAESVAPVGFLAAVAMTQALSRARNDLVGRLGVDEVRTRSLQLFTEAVERFAVPPVPVLADDEAARLIAALDDVQVRDAVASWGANGAAAPLVDLLRELARRTPPPFDAPITTTLAWVAYQEGDCTLAMVALDRALATDPAYSMARLLDEAVRRQVPPSALRAVSRQVLLPERPRRRRRARR